MSDVVELVLVAAGVAAVVVVAGLILARRTLRRRNRVSPAVASPAPLLWIVSPQPAARLHRRLRVIVATSRPYASVRLTRKHLDGALPAGADEFTRLAIDIERHCVALDRDLVAAARQPAARRQARLSSVAASVDDLDGAAARLAAFARSSTAQPALATPQGPLADIHDRLHAIEHARAEIAALENRAGIERPAGG